jgi:hypothetical protein
MELSQEEINSLDEETWKHYESGCCLCFAHDSSECICGSWDRPKPKRKPLPDGTLPLTENELEEFKQFIKDDVDSNVNMLFQEKIRILEKDIVAVFRNKATGNYQLLVISDYKAILYLANLFDLEV